MSWLSNYTDLIEWQFVKEVWFGMIVIKYWNLPENDHEPEVGDIAAPSVSQTNLANFGQLSINVDLIAFSAENSVPHNRRIHVDRRI